MSFTSFVSSFFSTVYADAPTEESKVEEPKAEEPKAEETPEASEEPAEEEEEPEPEDVSLLRLRYFSGCDVECRPTWTI